MEDEEGPAGAAEGYLKGKYYVSQFWGRRRLCRDFRLLTHITLYPT